MSLAREKKTSFTLIAVFALCTKGVNDILSFLKWISHLISKSHSSHANKITKVWGNYGQGTSFQSRFHVYQKNKDQKASQWLISSSRRTRLTVSKNLMPYSSANAWPFDVGTTYNTSFRPLMVICPEKVQNPIYNQRWLDLLPFGSHLSRLCYPPIFCLTFSEACCSIFLIHFLISAQAQWTTFLLN